MPPTVRSSRKGDIVEQAALLIARQGYSETSLRDVAEAVGISKGTILHHFGSKEHLLEHVHGLYMRRRLAEARLIVKMPGTPADHLAGLIYQLMVVQQTDRASTVAFAREFVRFASDDVMSEVRQMRDEYSALVRGVISDGMEQGDFRTEDPTLVTLMIFGMCNWSWTWYRPDGKKSPEEIAALFARSVLGGLMSGPGIELDEQLPDRVHEALDTVRAAEAASNAAASNASLPVA